MSNDLKLYDYVMAQLRSKRIPQRQAARESGVPFSTLCKIAQGDVTDPSVHTVQRLADYFAKQDEQKAA
jgi:transcriptional regulator with XRE-family HTH domain